MRRLMTITAFALFLVLPLWAQRGGGHVGAIGGGHAGFAPHIGGPGVHGGGWAPHVGGHPAAHFMPTPHPGFAHHFANVPRSGISGEPYLHDRFRQRFHGHRRHFGFRNNCYGYGCWSYGYPSSWGAGYYEPWWWWNDDSSYDEDYERNLALAARMNQESLEEQRMLRDEQAESDQELYARANSTQRPATADQNVKSNADPLLPATVLVFRDQHRQEIRNYAIVGQTLWNFTSQRTQKIPLPELDLPATRKANDDRGVVFLTPVTSKEQ